MIVQEEIERNYMDAKQAGIRLGLSPSRISRLCSSGRFIGAFKISGSWLIPKKAVETFEPLPPGPKPAHRILTNAINEAFNLKEGALND